MTSSPSLTAVDALPTAAAQAAPALSRKTNPRVWEVTYLVNRALIRDLREMVGRWFPRAASPRILDVGCGSMPYRALFDERCREYLGCDAYTRAPGIVNCPAEALIFDDESFEAVVSFEVLEHVRQPWKVVAECARVLRRGGILLLSTPFIFPHHASPHDYFRYTHDGLRALGEDAGLEVLELRAQCTSFATLLLVLNWHVMRFLNFFNRRALTRPLSWLLRWGAVVPANLLGAALDAKPLRAPADQPNHGCANFLIAFRKP